jgi:hypothetical protein
MLEFTRDKCFIPMWMFFAQPAYMSIAGKLFNDTWVTPIIRCIDLIRREDTYPYSLFDTYRTPDAEKHEKHDTLFAMLNLFERLMKSHSTMMSVITSESLVELRTKAFEIIEYCDPMMKYYDYEWEKKYSLTSTRPDHTDCPTFLVPSCKSNVEVIWKNIENMMECFSIKDLMSLDDKDQNMKIQLRYGRIRAGYYFTALRSFFTSYYSYAIPNREMVKNLASFIGSDTCLEVGAGFGLLSYFLQNEGKTVHVTDGFCGRYYDTRTAYTRQFCDVEALDGVRAAEKYRDANVLILVWPPFNTSMAYDALTHFKGNKIIYIGEGYDGCTGDEAFHSLLLEEWHFPKEDDSYDYPVIRSWAGIHDRVFLYERNVKPVIAKPIEIALASPTAMAEPIKPVIFKPIVLSTSTSTSVVMPKATPIAMPAPKAKALYATALMKSVKVIPSPPKAVAAIVSTSAIAKAAPKAAIDPEEKWCTVTRKHR